MVMEWLEGRWYWEHRAQMNPKGQVSPPTRPRHRTVRDAGYAIALSFCESHGLPTSLVLFCRYDDARVLHHLNRFGTADGAARASLSPSSPACVLFSHGACVPLRCPLTKKRRKYC